MRNNLSKKKYMRNNLFEGKHTQRGREGGKNLRFLNNTKLDHCLDNKLTIYKFTLLYVKKMTEQTFSTMHHVT